MSNQSRDNASASKKTEGPSDEHQNQPNVASPSGTTDYFNYWSSQLNVTQIAATLESKASELVELGRRSGLAEKAAEFVEITKENAFELAKHAQELKESYDKFQTETPGGSTKNAVAPAATIEREMDLTYITENIIAMAFPYDFKKLKNPNSVVGNDIYQVHKYLQEKHLEHYMIWNISEGAYDYSLFSDQVLDYKFPGHPAPPLGLTFKLCTSIESWLDADPLNVAVVHCFTGKGRTAALLACVLCWIGEFSSPIEALQYIAERKSISPEKLTIPSQRRYIQYFSNMIDGVKPRSEPLLLRRVIMNTIPIFGENNEQEGSLGCKPYIQLFKNGKLISTTASQHRATTSAEEDDGYPKWVDTNEGTVVFNVDCPVQGDILIRCRHADDTVRVSMFRAGFHTGYVPVGVLRMTKTQLDGPSVDSRFSEDFFIDLIFAPVVESSGGDSPTTTPPSPSSVPTDKGLTLDKSTADACEEFMHKDIRFWDAISSRKLRSRRRPTRKFLSQSQDRFSISDDIHIHESSPSPAVQQQDGAGTLSLISSKTSPAGISDNDLIMELTKAEAEPRYTTPAGKLTISTPIAATTTTTNTADLPSELAFLDDMDFKTPSAGTHSELRVLEDLEKELGLEEFIMPKPDTLSSSKKIAELHSAVEDDIDELEAYLQSLSSSTSSKP